MSELDTLKQALESAKAKLREQDAFLKKIAEPPLLVGVVVEMRRDSCFVAKDGQLLELNLPKDRDNIIEGAKVRLSPETMQIVGVISEGLNFGEVCSVRRVHDKIVEIEHGGSLRAVTRAPSLKVKEGESVIVDPSGRVVLLNLGLDPRYAVPPTVSTVEWDDIGGLANAKRELVEAIEMPFQYKDIFARYGKKAPKGILLYGPPGCGKTMLGKAVANSLSKTHGKSGSATSFIYVKGPEILDPYVGVAESNVRSLFKKSREHKTKYGYPAVIFIDEADAVLGKRGTVMGSSIDRTLVPMFLSEMDGLDESSAIVMLTSNRPDILDPAVVRDGRVDRKIKVDRPDRGNSLAIFLTYLRRRPLKEACGALAEIGCDELFSERRVLYQVRRQSKSDTLMITLGDLCNGAMIANVVDIAATEAMRREMKGGGKSGVQTGDMSVAVEQIYQQSRDLNHSTDVETAVAEFAEDVVSVKRA